MNMPVIISTGLQRIGVRRGYAIIEFKELGSENRHFAWKSQLQVQKLREKTDQLKANERRRS